MEKEEAAYPGACLLDCSCLLPLPASQTTLTWARQVEIGPFPAFSLMFIVLAVPLLQVVKPDDYVKQWLGKAGSDCHAD